MANGLLPLLRYLHRIAAGGTGEDQSDLQLLERFVRHQDETAFSLLIQRHARLVWNVCFRVLRDPHRTEDAFQATFLVFLRKAGSISHGDRLANWLYGVAFRVARKAKVQAGKQQASQKEMRDMPGSDTADSTTWDDLSVVLDEEVQRLPAKYREPLVLCYLKGLTNGEAARQLGCPEGTVVTWLARGRDKLRQRLRRRGMVLPATALASLMAENAASASVPTGAVDATLSITHTFLATGQLGLSASVAALTQGVLKDMMLIKVKIAAGVLAASVALAGSGWAVQQALADKPSDPVVQQPAEPAVVAAAAPKPEADRPLTYAEAMADKNYPPSKRDLKPENLAKFQSLIRPSEQEWQHLKVKWHTDLVAALKKAAKEDKPLVTLATGGAGYNDPLGVC